MSKLTQLASGVRWGGASTAVVAGFQLIFLAVISRLLEPADFGLVALANIALRFLSYFAQMGVGAAIVQKPEVDSTDVAAALSVSVGISLVCAGAALLLAPLAGVFFSMPNLAAVIQWLALAFVLSGFGAVSNGLLRRQMRFKRLAVNDAAAYLVGYGMVGIGMALAGADVWSLVAASLSQTAISVALGYHAVRHPLSFRCGRARRSHFLAYGGQYSLIGFLEFLGSNLDKILIGKMFGDAAAGLYNRALMVANLPVEQPVNVLSRALFPVLSSIGTDGRDKHAISLQISMIVVGSYAFAVAGGIAAAADDLVSVLLGAKWADSAPVLAVLALSVGPLFMSHVCGVTFDALGALGTKLRIQGAALAGLACALWLALPHGLVAVASAVLLIEALKMLAYLACATRALSIRPAAMARILVTVLAFGGAAAACVHAMGGLVQDFETPIFRLVLEIFAGTVGLLAGAIFGRWMLSGLPSVCWFANRFPRLSSLFSSTH